MIKIFNLIPVNLTMATDRPAMVSFSRSQRIYDNRQLIAIITCDSCVEYSVLMNTRTVDSRRGARTTSCPWARHNRGATRATDVRVVKVVGA